MVRKKISCPTLFLFPVLLRFGEFFNKYVAYGQTDLPDKSIVYWSKVEGKCVNKRSCHKNHDECINGCRTLRKRFYRFQGFARYSTDGKWHVPHFEKMLYDQGQLAVAYAYAFQATGDPEFSTIVEDILTYVSRDLSHPLGAFYSAEDADSKDKPEDDHKREGAFCVWTHEQLNNLLKQHTFKGTRN